MALFVSVLCPLESLALYFEGYNCESFIVVIEIRLLNRLVICSMIDLNW